MYQYQYIIWYSWVDSNHRPPDPQSAAPTSAFAHFRDDLGMRSTSLNTFRAIVVLDGCPQIAVYEQVTRNPDLLRR
jgi:hypothetical protein